MNIKKMWCGLLIVLLIGAAPHATRTKSYNHLSFERSRVEQAARLEKVVPDAACGQQILRKPDLLPPLFPPLCVCSAFLVCAAASVALSCQITTWSRADCASGHQGTNSR